MKREVSSVVAEARALVSAGTAMFFFCDSEVNLDLEDTNALLNALGTECTGITWSGYFRPVPFDRRMARLAAGSGCGDLTLSVNSWDLSRNDSPYEEGDVRRFLEFCAAEGKKSRWTCWSVIPARTRARSSALSSSSPPATPLP